MFDWLRAVGRKLAPAVCAFCDGGSGTIADENSGAIRSCPACGGTGDQTHHVPVLQELIDRRLRSGLKRRRRAA